jgi:hypothetical protein
MASIIGAALNDVLTEADKVPGGRTYKPGQLITDSTGGIFVCIKAAASQNIINGNVVYWDGSYNATIMPSGPGTPAGANMMAGLGVAVCSITASASQFFFAQVYGQGNVRVTDLTASNLPNHLLVMGSTPGEVKALSGTASLYIGGLVLTATASTATLSACFINFPRIAQA